MNTTADPLKWLRENAFFACDSCSEQAHDRNCYPADELKIVNERLICDGCYDAYWTPGSPEWGELLRFDPFGHMATARSSEHAYCEQEA